MTKIYIIRHCEGIGNIEHIFCGTTDTDISETGEKQLEKLAGRFANVHIDAVYSSPLIRAKKTARAVAEGKGLQIISDPALIELHGGFMEGKPFAETFKKHPDLAKLWLTRPQDFAPPEAEPMRNAYERIYDALCKITKRHKGQTVAICTHGGMIRCLQTRFLYGTIDRMADVPWSDNTDVMLVETDGNGAFTIKYLNDHSHLTNELLPESNRFNKLSFNKGEI